MYVGMHVWKYVCTDVCRVYVYGHAYIYMYLCIYVHICIGTHIPHLYKSSGGTGQYESDEQNNGGS